MTNSLIRRDIDGELIQFWDEPPVHYGKRLPTAVAWQIYDPQDLENVADAPVTAVTNDVAESAYCIHYHQTLDPLNLASLRQLLPLDSPFAVWRLTRLALDLSTALSALHSEGIAQLVIHPERVGRWNGKFTLLPTLAGILPPCSQLPANELGGWLHFVAPEVLRTRAMNKELLFAGDVYTLGRLLSVLLSPDWMPDTATDKFVLAEQCVESPEVSVPVDLPAESAALRQLFLSMQARLPAERPALAAIIAQLTELEAQLSPACRISALLQAEQHAEVEPLLADLMQIENAGVYGSWARLIHLTRADLALRQSPPECSLALVELGQIETEVYEAEIQQRMGRAYSLFTSLPDYAHYSSAAYARAAASSNWDESILDEWMSALKHFTEPDDVLAATDGIPLEKRTRSVVTLRTETWEQKQAFFDAWYEISQGLRRFPFDSQLFEMARRVAARNDPLDLMRWMRPYRDNPEAAAAVSLVWEANGNLEMAAQKLIEAQTYIPVSPE